MAEEPQRRAVSLTEFARVAGLSPSTVAGYLDQGVIPELERLGTRRFIPRDWVDQWLSTPINRAPASGARSVTA